MCPPVLAIAGLAASVIGTGVGVAGAVSQGHAQQAQMNYQAQVAQNNATVASQNAAAVQQQAAVKAQADQRAGDLRLSSQRAALGASGTALGAGSGNQVQSATIQNTGIATQNDLYQGQLAAYGYGVQGSNYAAQSGLDTASGSNASTAGFVNAGSTLLSGASQVSSKWASYQQQTGGWGGLSSVGATGNGVGVGAGMGGLY